MLDVQQLSQRVGRYVQPVEQGKQAVPDPFLRQLVQGSAQAKLKKLHTELVAGADPAELALTKRSQMLQESLAALLQAFDAGGTPLWHSHATACHAPDRVSHCTIAVWPQSPEQVCKGSTCDRHQPASAAIGPSSSLTS